MTLEIITIEEKIMNAALSVFIEKGYESAKMQHIADKAGIKRTALNYYFRTKDALYRQTSKRIIQQSLPHLLNILNNETSFDKKINEFVEAYITLAIKNPFLQLFMVNEINNLGAAFMDKIIDNYKPRVYNFLKQIENEITKGNIINVNPIQIHLHLISLCIFPIMGKPMVKLILDLDEEQYHAIIEERKTEIVRLFLKGIQP